MNIYHNYHCVHACICFRANFCEKRQIYNEVCYQANMMRALKAYLLNDHRNLF